MQPSRTGLSAGLGSVLLLASAGVLAVVPTEPLPGRSCPPVAHGSVLPAATADAPPSSPGSVDAADLTVFAAASLSEAFVDLQAPWTLGHPGSELSFSFDASSALRAQIEQGAPADVLASADTSNPQALVDACLAPGPVTPFASNRLVIVVPAGNPGGLVAPWDLARPGLRIVAAGPDVPITRYAQQAIERLGELPGHPVDFAAAVAANVVSEEDNVRAVLAKIELGEGDAAIVYLTDAASSLVVETIPIPDEVDVRPVHAAVAVHGSPSPDLAADFLSFLVSPEGQAVLQEHRFGPAP